MMTAHTALCRFESLPFATLGEIIGPGPPLILAPHPDDESLGCGGLIAACCARHTPPAIVVVTDGAGSHPTSRTHPPHVLRAVREQEARDAARLLGVAPGMLAFLGLPDTAAPRTGPAFHAAVEMIKHIARASNCHAILAPWRHDPHCDHEAADTMAARAARIVGIPHLSYPVWGWTLQANFPLPDTPITGWRLDISAHFEAKRAAIAAHASQYSDLITDDPTGFRLPAELLAVFARPYEVFVRA